jgi:hypothetical protein
MQSTSTPRCLFRRESYLICSIKTPTFDRVLALEPLQRHGRGLVKASVGRRPMADRADPSLDVD